MCCCVKHQATLCEFYSMHLKVTGTAVSCAMDVDVICRNATQSLTGTWLEI